MGNKSQLNQQPLFNNIIPFLNKDGNNNKNETLTSLASKNGRHSHFNVSNNRITSSNEKINNIEYYMK